ncbi:MAG TPA: lasso peptide biosynthesis B2 protein [Thermoanaerobaculia bacterium]|nr:lasso peptide biosynthesis B2 protein [Thermoanaerobaculia bacterium]
MADRLLLTEVFFRLIAARLAVALLSFPSLKRRLGQHMAESPREDDPSHRELLRRIRWSLGAISRRVPWRCMCLERSIAGKMMLRSRRVPNTLYLGVARSAERSSAICAHAWLRSGAISVTGGDGSGHYAIVSTFADMRSMGSE